MTFTAQQLCHCVQLQRNTPTQGSFGDVINQWSTYASVYARVDPLVGREFFAAMSVNAEHSVKFTMRYRPDLRVTDQLVWQGQAYDITAVQHIGGRNRETLVVAKILDS